MDPSGPAVPVSVGRTARAAVPRNEADHGMGPRPGVRREGARRIAVRTSVPRRPGAEDRPPLTGNHDMDPIVVLPPIAGLAATIAPGRHGPHPPIDRPAANAGLPSAVVLSVGRRIARIAVDREEHARPIAGADGRRRHPRVLDRTMPVTCAARTARTVNGHLRSTRTSRVTSSIGSRAPRSAIWRSAVHSGFRSTSSWRGA